MWTCNETLPFTSQAAEYRKSETEPGFVFLVCSPFDSLLHSVLVVKLYVTLYSHISRHSASCIRMDCATLKCANLKVIGFILISFVLKLQHWKERSSVSSHRFRLLDRFYFS